MRDDSGIGAGIQQPVEPPGAGIVIIYIVLILLSLSHICNSGSIVKFHQNGGSQFPGIVCAVPSECVIRGILLHHMTIVNTPNMGGGCPWGTPFGSPIILPVLHSLVDT